MRAYKRAWGFVALGGSVLGAALQLQQAALWHAPVYAAFLLFGVAGLWWRRGPSWLLWCVALACGAMVGGGLAGWRATAYAQGTLDPALEGRDLQVVGVVAEMPAQGGDGAVRFRLDVESANWAAADPLPRMPRHVALGWYPAVWGSAPAIDAVAPVHAGERWRLVVRLRAPHGTLNPHGADSELSMWEQGVHAVGYVRSGSHDARPSRVATTWLHPVERAREAVRDAVFARVPDRAQAGVIAALVTGDQGAIDRSGWDVFRATGVAHLMSISGLHITMFAWLAARLVGLLWRRSGRLMLWLPAQQAGLVGGVLLAGLYALFSGWGVPAQRTVCMLATVALLRLAGGRWPWPHVWLLTMAVVVALDPWALMQAGFWLSFVAVGVLFATDAGVPLQGRRRGAAGLVVGFVREQWVITLALTPLTLLLFQQVSLVGLLANAIAIPWVTMVVTPLAMLGVALPSLWSLAACAVQGFVAALQWLCALPWATMTVAAPPAALAGCGVAGGVLLAMPLPWTLRSLGVSLMLPVLLWQAPRPPTGEFELVAADIGQGDAVLVRTARHTLLFDTGPRYGPDSDAGHRVLVPLLRAMGERLDLLVLSHRDIDHTGGAPAVLAMQPQTAVLSSIEATHPLQALPPAQRCLAGQRWQWDGVDFEILHPVESDYTVFAKPNTVSCVLRIGNGHAGALLTGDIERAQEEALVARTPAPGLHADVMLAPHHGSKTSSSGTLLAAVQPRIALVQAGYRNRFGHPAREVLARYAQRGVRVVENTRCGAATWRSVQPDAVVCERERRARYWHHSVP